MLGYILISIIPKNIDHFPKLKKKGEPYYFWKWDNDKDNNLIMRYWFWNKEKNYRNKKRVFIFELRALLQFSLENNGFSRENFIQICPRTFSDGECGFAVIVGILKYFKIITKRKTGVYEIINKYMVLELLS